jgi:hypothetical protein
VSVFVLGSVSNQSKDHLAPPGRKLLRVELRDARGMLVQPESSITKLQSALPARMLIKDFPMIPQRGQFAGRGAMFKDIMLLGPDGPYPLVEFNVLDYFSIKEDGMRLPRSSGHNLYHLRQRL